MRKLFISYRREDSAGLAGRIYDRVQSHFGSDSVFMDVDSIPYGVDFRQHLTEAVAKCDVLLAVIAEREGLPLIPTLIVGGHRPERSVWIANDPLLRRAVDEDRNQLLFEDCHDACLHHAPPKPDP